MRIHFRGFCQLRFRFLFYPLYVKDLAVPRKSPFPKREREICRRLREFRKLTKLSRVAFAEIAGLDASLVRSYEMGRSQLNFRAAHSLIKGHNINPAWLATGDGPMVGKIGLPSPTDLNLRHRALFSVVFDNFLTKGLELPDHLPVVNVREAEARHLIWGNIRTDSYGWLGHVPHDKLDSFFDSIQAAAQQEIASYGYQDHAILWNRQLELERIDKRHFPGLSPGDPPGMKGVDASESTNDLTNSATESKSSDVKPKDLWPALKRALQETTAGTPGAKSALADFLEVELSRVSQWLSDSPKTAREPGAEYALLMQTWLKNPKRQGK